MEATLIVPGSVPVTRREFLYYIWATSSALITAESTGAIIWFAIPRFRSGEFGGKFTIEIDKRTTATSARATARRTCSTACGLTARPGATLVGLSCEPWTRAATYWPRPRRGTPTPIRLPACQSPSRSEQRPSSWTRPSA